jgi:hypothetical protein
MKKSLLVIFALIIVSKVTGSVALVMPDLSGQSGTQITVPVKVGNFTDIVSAQGTIQFDPSIITYVSVQQFGLTGMNGSSFGTSGTGTGKLTFSWYDGTLAGVTLADSTVLFSITFNIIGTNGQVSALSFVNSPTIMEIIDNAFNTLPLALNDGSVTVMNASSTPAITLFLDNASGMVGSGLSVSMKAVDFTNINSIQGTIQFDPSAVTYSSVSFFGLPGMNMSNFGTSQAATGKITFTWFDGTLNGVDMADSTALFTLNFTASCTPGVSSIDIVNSPTLVEVTDSSLNTLTTTLVSGAITNQAMSVSAQSSATGNICEGTSATLTAMGASGYTWLPSGSLSSATGSPVTATPTITTVYTVTATSGSCSTTANVTVTVDPLPIAGYTFTDNGNGSITYTSSSQYTTSFSWNFGDGNTSTTSPATHVYSSSAVYQVMLTATNACGTDTSIMNVNVNTTGIKSVSGNEQLAVYPNPGNGLFNLKYDSFAGNDFTIEIMNGSGAIVLTEEYTKTASANLFTFDLSKFDNGMYHILVRDKSQVLHSRIILNK